MREGGYETGRCSGPGVERAAKDLGIRASLWSFARALVFFRRIHDLLRAVGWGLQPDGRSHIRHTGRRRERVRHKAATRHAK